MREEGKERKRTLKTRGGDKDKKGKEDTLENRRNVGREGSGKSREERRRRQRKRK